MTTPVSPDGQAEVRWRWAPWAVALVALLAMASSLGNGFAMDDVSIVEANAAVHDAAHWWHRFAESYWPDTRGGGLYRPLAMVAYTGLWAVGGGSAAPFHAANVVLYVALCLAMLRLSRALLGETAAVVAALLFAAHPVHVEAVANVVGMAELLAALPMVLAVALYLEWRARGDLTPRQVVALTALSAVACFGKENGVMLVLLLGAAELIVIPATNGRGRRLVPLFAALAVVAVTYVSVRSSVLRGMKGEFAHVVWVVNSGATRHLTMLGVSLDWLRLLLWPARLAAEYTPPHVAVITGWDWLLVPALLLVSGVVSVAALGRRRWPVPAFACAWLVITLLPVSNTLVAAGLILGERTLLMPSVAAMVLVGWVLERALTHAREAATPSPLARPLAGVIVTLLVVGGTWRSATRSPVWRDNQTLFEQTVRDVPDSYRAHYHLGAWYLDHDRLKEGERELRQAIALYPLDFEPGGYLAEAYRKHDLCIPALPLYRKALAITPSAGLVRAGYVVCLMGGAQFDSARAVARRGMRPGWEAVSELERLIGVADSLERTGTIVPRTEREVRPGG